MSLDDSIKVNMVSASDYYGGAGIASYRLLKGLIKVDVTAELFVGDKRGNDNNVIGPKNFICDAYSKLLPYLDPVPKLKYTKHQRDAWSCNFLPNPCLPISRLNQADIVHLHWVGGGILPIRAFRQIGKPLVWTLHDSWPFTGGCHILYDCLGYQECCGDCPQLKSGKERDLSRLIWQRKSQSWRGLKINIVAPSSWMASVVKQSALFGDYPITVIPNGIDVSEYSPLDTAKTRENLGLPLNKRLLLFSAMGGLKNWNKGGDLLLESLAKFSEVERNDFVLLLCGEHRTLPKNTFPIPFINMGYLSDVDMKRKLYASADLTVMPSRSENLANVAIESMACGTPCVGFSVGGIPDIIDHKVNGVLVNPYSTEEFAHGIKWLLTGEERRKKMLSLAREKVVRSFSHLAVAKQYRDLYAQLLEDRRSSKGDKSGYSSTNFG